MPTRFFRFVLILLLGAGVPYAWFSDLVSPLLRAKVTSLMGSSRANETTLLAPQATTLGPVGHSHGPGAAPQATPTPQAGFERLEEVLRMDISPAWVTRRWPRVSTVRADPNLQGLRVPYVSGTGVDDVSGSLTYYFDAFGRVSRLTLDGRTGDTGRLLSVTNGMFGLKSEPNLRAGLYVARWNAEPTSALWISLAPVVRTDQPHSRYEFKLEVNRPDVGCQLSRELAVLLEQEVLTHAVRHNSFD